ncbi:MAG: hypothetical protein LUD78_09165 [Clostridiales bacterium]|nr:hypothetical protein [Clostridiales bacterium]
MKDKKKKMTQEEMCRRCPDYPCEMAVEMGVAPKEGVNSDLDIQRWERMTRKDDESRADADYTAAKENGKASEKAMEEAEMIDEEKEQEIRAYIEAILKEMDEDNSPEGIQRRMVNDMVYLFTLAGSINTILYFLSTGRMDPFTAYQNGNAIMEAADHVLEKWQVHSPKKEE